MLVSIVTPTLALDEVLSEARASVKRQYAHVTIEHIIVVDDPDAVLPPDSQSGNVFTYFSHNTQKKGPGARGTLLLNGSRETSSSFWMRMTSGMTITCPMCCRFMPRGRMFTACPLPA